MEALGVQLHAAPEILCTPYPACLLTVPTPPTPPLTLTQLKGGVPVVGDATHSADPCPPIDGVPTTLVSGNVWVQPWRDFAQVTLTTARL